MNVAAGMAVWCHACAATVGVCWVLLAVAGASWLLLLVVAGVSLGVVVTGVCAASRLVERCSSGFFGSCVRLIAACMSAAFTCAAFLSLLSVGGVGVARPRRCACCFLLGSCVALALLVLVLRVLDAAGRVLGGARDGLAEAFACFRVVACGEFGVVCAERGLGCAHVVVFNIVQCGGCGG